MKAFLKKEDLPKNFDHERLMSHKINASKALILKAH